MANNPRISAVSYSDVSTMVIGGLSSWSKYLSDRLASALIRTIKVTVYDHKQENTYGELAGISRAVLKIKPSPFLSGSETLVLSPGKATRQKNGYLTVRLTLRDHPEGLASCKWSSGGTSLLQMMIRKDRLLTNDHPEGPASCK